MNAVLIAAGIPAAFVLEAFVLAVVKDGSPLRRDFWTAGK
jgi:hypothetical protein